MSKSTILPEVLAISGLTLPEKRALQLTIDLAGTVNKILTVDGHDPDQAAWDRAELFGAIHTVQRAIIAQAAARANPESLRLLGHSFATIKEVRE